MTPASDHIRRIEASVSSADAEQPSDDWRTASWSRCIQRWRLDPARPEIVEASSHELKQQESLFTADLSVVGSELESVLSIIEGGGYSAYLANSEGTIIVDRKSQDASYYCPTDRIGAVWTEAIGGTNAIGTSLLTLEPCSVYLSDHFFADFTIQGCVAAPFFDHAGEVLGVINFSSRNPALPLTTHKVVYAVAQDLARRLETRFFREHFRQLSVVSLRAPGNSPALLAVDEDFRVIGASRFARHLLSLGEGSLGVRGLWGIFERPKAISHPAQLSTIAPKLRPLNGRGAYFEATSRPPMTPKARGGSIVVRETRKQSTQSRRRPTLAECVGQDPRMKENVDILLRLMGSGPHLLLLGESGVGKDTLARALHDACGRPNAPYVAFNCSAVPESLIDSELFGYSSGAFTGANHDGSQGRICEAHGGTLFLDEIGDMAPTLQTRLLRFLETGEVTPLGGGKTRYVDCQVVAATNQDLVELMRQGKFRRDLFHRLTGAVVTIPSLRERQDIAYLAEQMVAEVADGRGLRLSGQAIEQILNYDWPGNIRELRNVLLRAVNFCDSKTIEPRDLTAGGLFMQLAEPGRPGPHGGPHGGPSAAGVRMQSQAVGASDTLAPSWTNAKAAVDTAERAAVESAVRQAAGDPIRCAALLGVSRATLYRKLKRHGLSMA